MVERLFSAKKIDLSTSQSGLRSGLRNYLKEKEEGLMATLSGFMTL